MTYTSVAPILVPVALLVRVVDDNGVDVLGAANCLAGPVQLKHLLLGRVARVEVEALPVAGAARHERGRRHGGAERQRRRRPRRA